MRMTMICDFVSPQRISVSVCCCIKEGIAHLFSQICSISNCDFWNVWKLIIYFTWPVIKEAWWIKSKDIGFLSRSDSDSTTTSIEILNYIQVAWLTPKPDAVPMKAGNFDSYKFKYFFYSRHTGRAPHFTFSRVIEIMCSHQVKF